MEEKRKPKKEIFVTLNGFSHRKKKWALKAIPVEFQKKKNLNNA